jgi:hypothetical protein
LSTNNVVCAFAREGMVCGTLNSESV